ncbi:MAG: LytTR family transcriptional regulator DNA-binding domain-containing protein [Sphingobacterium sp.]
MNTKPIKYKDTWFRIIVCLFAAHFLVMVGEKVDTLEALTIPSYYPTLVINYIIALLIAFAVKKISMIQDKRFPWELDLLKRLLYQFVFGVVLVSILSFLLVFIYFISFSQDILASTYPAYEFPFSVVLILCLNFFYASYYFYQLKRRDDDNPNPDKESSVVLDTSAIPLLKSDSENTVQEDKRDKKEILIIDTPTRSIPIKICDLAFAFVSNGTTFVFLKGMDRLQDGYIMSSPLKELEDAIDAEQFYRINRKCIVNFESISAFKAGQERTLILMLKPDLISWTGMEKQELTKLCTVSADRVAAFKRWIDR